MKPPTLNSAPTFRESPPPSPVADFRPPTSRRLVIIGNGMAGYKLCEQLVAAGANRRYEITVFGEEPRPAYDRVHLTDVLGGRTLDELTLAPREWYRQHGIRLHTNHRVVSVDREKRELVTDGAIAGPRSGRGRGRPQSATA